MTTNHNDSTFPAVPPSLSAGDRGMQDDYVTQDTQRSTPHTVSNITPYLGLRSRLSQIWINRWTILLFLVLVRTLLAIVGLNHDLASAKTEAMSACSSVEDMGSAMASMPHYLSAGVNELTAAGVEKAVNGLYSMLLLTITGAEELLVFYVNMMTSTYMCLITLAVSSSLHVALEIIEDAEKFLNSTVKAIGKDIGSGIKVFEDGVNKFAKGINSLPGMGNKVPTIDETNNLNKLQNLALPSDLNKDLDKLNNSIPTFQDVQNFTDNVLRLPFEEVKKLLRGKLNYTFDRAVLPVPQKEQLSFCSDKNGIEKFFDDLAHVAEVARKAFIAVLVILAILVCIPMTYQEYRRWNTMKRRSELVADKSYDPLDVMYIVSRPYTATAGIKASAPFKSPKTQTLTRWVIAYSTSTPALFVLSLGVTGLLACFCQYILLKAVEKEVPALANDVGHFADMVMNKLNNASDSWAMGTNKAMSGLNHDINNEVFGWVNKTTGAINETLNVFINETIGELNKTFGGTILYEPVTGIFECLIGLKVASIQKGLTWVSDNAHVNFPLVQNDTFSRGAAASISTADPSSGANNNILAAPGAKAADKITGAVAKVVDNMIDALKTEAIISTCILLVWLTIVLIGIGRALFLVLRAEKGRGEGGPSYAGDIPMDDQRAADHGFSIQGPAPAYESPQPNATVMRGAIPNSNDPFRDPMGHTRRESDISDGWQDQKVGFGGFREPYQVEAPRHQSYYPSVEKH